MVIHAALHHATIALKNASFKEALLEARLLLEYILNVNQAWLMTHADAPISSQAQSRFNALIERRLHGEPIAYILGKREFYGLTLMVSPATLIPRSDTETLVDVALIKIPKNQPCTVLDLGTGTGAIALAVAKHKPQAQITAIDYSVGALKVAKENAKNLSIKNIHFIQSNWFNALKNQSFDIIVSNPPYIKKNDSHLKQGDLRFEPRLALASGADGLSDIRQIIGQARAHLNSRGWLMLEHGYNQAKTISGLLKKAKFSAIKTTQDLSGNHRVTIGQLT